MSLLRRSLAGDLKRSKALVARQETAESGVTTYVTMKGSRCQPWGSRNLSWPARIITAV